MNDVLNKYYKITILDHINEPELGSLNAHKIIIHIIRTIPTSISVFHMIKSF